MIKHLVLLKFAANLDEQRKHDFMAQVAALAQHITPMNSFQHGPAAAVNSGKYDYGVVAEFETETDYQHYIQHEAHQALAGKMAGIIEDAASLQFEY